LLESNPVLEEFDPVLEGSNPVLKEPDPVLEESDPVLESDLTSESINEDIVNITRTTKIRTAIPITARFFLLFFLLSLYIDSLLFLAFTCLDGIPSLNMIFSENSSGDICDTLI